MVKNEFFTDIGTELIFYPMLAQPVLRRDHRNWWRSANLRVGAAGARADGDAGLPLATSARASL